MPIAKGNLFVSFVISRYGVNFVRSMALYKAKKCSSVSNVLYLEIQDSFVEVVVYEYESCAFIKQMTLFLYVNMFLSVFEESLGVNFTRNDGKVIGRPLVKNSTCDHLSLTSYAMYIACCRHYCCLFYKTQFTLL